MSTITFVDDTEIEAGQVLTEAEALKLFVANPEALMDLIYGPARRVAGAAPGHDHDEDGGEPHRYPILQRSFGRYQQNISVLGIPLGKPAVADSFAPVFNNGIEDFTAAKRLDCCMVILPGGVSSVRVSLTEYHETSGQAVRLIVALRSLSSVNYKLGVASEEVRGEFVYTGVGSPGTTNKSIVIDDLLSLGDAEQDRQVEASLWLAFDLGATNELKILDWEILPVGYSARARSATPLDLVHPEIAVREIKGGMGLVSPQLLAKIKELYNGMNRGLIGSTPGLSAELQPDRRRDYQEPIEGTHQHQGSFCPTVTARIFGDGAVLQDAQSFAFLTYLGETLPLVAGTPPEMDHRPNQGNFLHFTPDLTAGWFIYRFRRSIPAGCGEIKIRVGAHPGYGYGAPSFDTSLRLLVSIDVVPVLGGASIVTRLLCGPNASPMEASDPEFGFVEVDPEESPAHLSNLAIALQNKKPWSRGAEVTGAERDAMQLNEVLYRVSQEIRVLLSYPPLRPSESFHATADYEVRVRFKLLSDAGDADGEAGFQWICCYSAPGY